MWPLPRLATLENTELLPVLVSLATCQSAINRVTYNQKFTGRLRLGCQQGQALVRAPPWLVDGHVLTWPFPGAYAQRELRLSGVSSDGDPNPIRPGPCPGDQVTPEGPISKANTSNLGGHNP